MANVARTHFTSEQILDISRKENFKVHKHAWHDSRTRKRCWQLVKKGLLRLADSRGEYFEFTTIL